MKQGQTGFTLIELLITLGLSVFILSAAYLLFFSARKIYFAQQAMIQVQETGRIAVNILRDRIRAAGGLGCRSWNHQFPVFIQANTLSEWIPKQASDLIQFYKGENKSWSPSLPTYLQNRVRENTDVAIIHQAYEKSTYLLQAMANTDVPLLLPSSASIELGDVLIISDCEKADIFQVSSVARQSENILAFHQPPYNNSSALSKAYDKNAYISLLKNVAYYIGDTGRFYENNTPVYALFEYSNGHQELIEGVSDLKIHSKNQDKIISLAIETVFNGIKENWPVIINRRN